MLELRHFVDDFDDVDPLLAALVALVDGVDAEEAGPPAGPGLRRVPMGTEVAEVVRKERRPRRYALDARRL